jgi:hypothetical protein
MLSDKDGFTTKPEYVRAKAGVMRISLPALSATVLYHKN